MTKKLALMTLMTLSVSALALTACDDSKDTAAPAAIEETTAEVIVDETAVAPDAAVEDAVQASPISVTTPHAFATAEGATTGAIFATLANNQDKADFLLSASTELADAVEIHQTYQDPQTGAYVMRKTSGIDIPANGKAVLEPAGFHIMLIGLKRPLAEGEVFPVTFTFRESGAITTDVIVTPAGGAQEGVSEDGHEGHDHGTDETAAEELEAPVTPEAVPVPADDGIATGNVPELDAPAPLPADAL